MEGDKAYVTQITRRDLSEIAAMTKLTVGEGLQLSRAGSGWKLELDRYGLIKMLAEIGVVIGGEF